MLNPDRPRHSRIYQPAPLGPFGQGAGQDHRRLGASFVARTFRRGNLSTARGTPRVARAQCIGGKNRSPKGDVHPTPRHTLQTAVGFTTLWRHSYRGGSTALLFFALPGKIGILPSRQTPIGVELERRDPPAHLDSGTASIFGGGAGTREHRGPAPCSTELLEQTQGLRGSTSTLTRRGWTVCWSPARCKTRHMHATAALRHREVLPSPLALRA